MSTIILPGSRKKAKCNHLNLPISFIEVKRTYGNRLLITRRQVCHDVPLHHQKRIEAKKGYTKRIRCLLHAFSLPRSSSSPSSLPSSSLTALPSQDFPGKWLLLACFSPAFLLLTSARHHHGLLSMPNGDARLVQLPQQHGVPWL